MSQKVAYMFCRRRRPGIRYFQAGAANPIERPMRTTLGISFASDTLGNEIGEGHRKSDRYPKRPAAHIGLVKSIVGLVADDIDMGEAMVLAY
jgi:hypothetical protein